MQKAALYTSGVIFAAVSFTHLVRLITGIEIVVGGVVAPVWVSFPGMLIAALLAIWMVVAARRSYRNVRSWVTSGPQIQATGLPFVAITGRSTGPKLRQLQGRVRP